MRLRPAGRDGVLLEPDSAVEVSAVRAALRRTLRPEVEIIPSANIVLVLGISDAERKALSELEVGEVVAGDVGPLVEVPVVYDGEDLAEVSRLTGLTEPAIVELHTSTDFVVGFCGFSPGFAYLTGLPDVLRVPRRDTPRTRVPTGSVAIAGPYAAVYPGPSPGGWRLIGRTNFAVWDVNRTPPALLSPGTRVRFVAVDELEEPAQAVPAASTRQDLTVIRAGAMTTIQDAGRPGYADVGVPRSGALDLPALRLANRLVGNDEDAAALETTFTGCAFVLETARYLAVAGALSRVTVDGHDVGPGTPFYANAGAIVEIHPADAGVRSYIAVAGGIDAPPILGSRSTDLLSGLGPRPLDDGDYLALGVARSLPPGADESFSPQPVDEPVLRLMPGPRDDWFTEAAWEALRTSTYEVTADSNRVGLRLAGPPLERHPDRRGVELASEGMPPGALQVPPDGQPVLFLADHPTTGGYPVIGCVDVRDLHHAAQARPGTALRFRAG